MNDDYIQTSDSNDNRTVASTSTIVTWPDLNPIVTWPDLNLSNEAAKNERIYRER